MTKQDRQKLSILLVLLAVFGLTAVLGYRMYEPSTTASRQPAPEAKTSANPPAPSDARIRLDLVEKSEGSEEDIGRLPSRVRSRARPCRLLIRLSSRCRRVRLRDLSRRHLRHRSV